MLRFAKPIVAGGRFPLESFVAADDAKVRTSGSICTGGASSTVGMHARLYRC